MPGVLAGKVALVTGASSGIGLATALELADAGAAVAVMARRPDRVREVVERVERAGGAALALPANVTDETQAAQAVADTASRFGRLDILVNCAGMTQVGQVEGAVLDDWREVHAVNFWATLYMCRAALPYLKCRGGDIVNISSTAGRRSAGPNFGPYSTSKFALTALSEGLRQEVGAAGVRVTVVEPGATDTGIHEAINDPQVREGMRMHLAEDVAMAPDDVARTIVFIVALPERVNVSQILIRPTADVRAM